MTGPGVTCGPTTSVTVDEGQIPDGHIGQGFWHGEQLLNAAIIINVAADMGLSQRDQTIGVMTAMGESSLIVLDSGDAAGPDSRGLFQQRDNGAWGTYEDRMDPARSAEMFFEVLAQVEDRDDADRSSGTFRRAVSQLEARGVDVHPEDPATAASLVAHEVQVNADPMHYAPLWDDAQLVVAELAGIATSAVPVAAERCETIGGGGQPQISNECGPVSASTAPPACQAYAALTVEFGDFWDPAGGVGCQRDEPGSDHHTGHACDYMMSPGGVAPSDTLHNQALVVVQWLMDHHEALGVTYILYDEAIWTAGRDPYGAWADVRRAESYYGYDHFYNDPRCIGRADRHNCAITMAHIDHIHLSTR